MPKQQSVRAAGWAEQIPDEQWRVYLGVLEQARRQQFRFALGGAFAVATYTEQWRNTKDLDIYILHDDRAAFSELLSGQGMHDYYDTLSYDRGWIYRAFKGDTIVDLIFRMANQRADVDEQWLTRGVLVNLRGFICRVIPVEEMVWDKLYVFQRDRCDWPDVMNLPLAGLGASARANSSASPAPDSRFDRLPVDLPGPRTGISGVDMETRGPAAAIQWRGAGSGLFAHTAIGLEAVVPRHAQEQPLGTRGC